MRREQKTVKTGWTCESTVETESSKGVRSITALETAEKNGAELFERILHRNNLNAAYKRVKQNGGAAGVDGMTVEEMLPYLKEYGNELIQSIREGRYKPQPVRRVEIPKPDGGVRLLGVPTVIDRMIQQAVVQVLQPIFERTFSDSSYGFRPRRNAQQAIRRAKDYYDEGYTQVVDLDLAKYFDTVNHDLLMLLRIISILIHLLRCIRHFRRKKPAEWPINLSGIIRQNTEVGLIWLKSKWALCAVRLLQNRFQIWTLSKSISNL